MDYHINYLEMKAIFLALKSFLPLRITKHVRVFTDNFTALTYINKQGGITSKECNSMAIAIWEVCLEYDSHITAAHIPGKHNTLADTASRKFDDSKEWMLDPIIFSNLCTLWGTPSIDLFASRTNNPISMFHTSLTLILVILMRSHLGGILNFVMLSPLSVSFIQHCARFVQTKHASSWLFQTGRLKAGGLCSGRCPRIQFRFTASTYRCRDVRRGVIRFSRNCT